RLEREVWEKAGIPETRLRQARLRGSRRPAQSFPQNLTIEPHPEGLLLTFSLRKGAYATTVLREFCKEALRAGDPGFPEALP
ncbi:MAG: tRNA pseudouridine(13) synthase TruD, partial [Nitrospinota bacterium]